MEWTVSTAKGVRKLSLTCRVICTWTWSRAVTSLYVRTALMEQNVSRCDFSADAGPRGSFHRENVSTGAKLTTQPAEPVWLHDWHWPIKQNLLCQWETTRPQSANAVLSHRHWRPSEAHKSTVLTCLRSITLYHHHNANKYESWRWRWRRKEALETRGKFSSGVIFTLSAA